MIKYYKVMRNGWGEDFISIEEKDLMRAIYSKLNGDVLIKGGLIDGSKIEMIVPDYHKTLGYNYGYRLQPEDYEEIRGKVGDMHERIAIASDTVKGFLDKGRVDLIENTDFIPIKKEKLALPPDIKNRLGEIEDNFKIK